MAGDPDAPQVPDLSAAPLLEILAYVQARRAAGATLIAFWVLDPDLGRGRYAGEPVERAASPGVALHRPWRVWIELADRLGLRLLTPRPALDPASGAVRLAFEPLAPAARWQDAADAAPASSADRTERYGATSGYARIHKAEEPGFVLDLADALARCKLPPRPRVLDLGVNDGDELALMMALAPQLAAAHFTGVDHSASALAVARGRFAAEQVRLVCADLNAELEVAAQADGAGPLGRFDLVVCFGTLQSPGVDDRQLLRRVVQQHLAPGGAVILGVPNCRYLDGELVHGARMRNFRQPELGLVVKDLAFYRKYLQQHDRQVFVTGHHTLLLTAVAC
jgi:SAM-dependent methyltransferase